MNLAIHRYEDLLMPNEVTSFPHENKKLCFLAESAEDNLQKKKRQHDHWIRTYASFSFLSDYGQPDASINRTARLIIHETRAVG